MSMRWVLRKKPKADDPKYVRARLCAQQIKKLRDVMDTFAASPTSVGHRIVISRAMRRGWRMYVIDIKTAFLHAPLPPGAKIFLQPPQTEIRNLRENEEGEIWRAEAAVYGLRQSPRWFQEWLADQLIARGFRRLTSDAQVFLREDEVTLYIHADDMLLVVDEKDYEKVVKELGRPSP